MIDIRLGDCFELIKDLPDNSVDLVITSPPYADIVNYAVWTKKDENVPIQAAKPVEIEGIFYRNNMLDVNDIKKNRRALEQMRKIFNSKELAKALKQLFEQNKISTDEFINAYKEVREFM